MSGSPIRLIKGTLLDSQIQLGIVYEAVRAESRACAHFSMNLEFHKSSWEAHMKYSESACSKT